VTLAKLFISGCSSISRAIADSKPLTAISQFAKVELFKPTTAHAARSSFYLVAKEIDVQSPLVGAALAEWKSQWYAATFGGPEGTGEKCEPEESIVLSVLKTFGPKLIEMGVPLWRIQADALAQTTYAGDVGGPSLSFGKKEA
jgi:hypothetical protein